MKPAKFARCAQEEFAMTFYDIDQGFAQAGIEEAKLKVKTQACCIFNCIHKFF